MERTGCPGRPRGRARRGRVPACPADTTFVGVAEFRKSSGVPLDAIPLAGRGGPSVAYQVTWQGKTVLVGAPAGQGEPGVGRAIVPRRRAGRAPPRTTCASLDRLMHVRPDLSRPPGQLAGPRAKRQSLRRGMDGDPGGGTPARPRLVRTVREITQAAGPHSPCGPSPGRVRAGRGRRPQPSGPPPAGPLQRLQQDAGRLRVEVGGRLVGEHYFGPPARARATATRCCSPPLRSAARAASLAPRPMRQPLRAAARSRGGRPGGMSG